MSRFRELFLGDLMLRMCTNDMIVSGAAFLISTGICRANVLKERFLSLLLSAWRRSRPLVVYQVRE